MFRNNRRMPRSAEIAMATITGVLLAIGILTLIVVLPVATYLFTGE